MSIIDAFKVFTESLFQREPIEDLVQMRSNIVPTTLNPKHPRTVRAYGDKVH